MKQSEYCPVFDSYYWSDGQWNEFLCNDPDCEFCKDRPLFHSDDCTCKKEETNMDSCPISQEHTESAEVPYRTAMLSYVRWTPAETPPPKDGDYLITVKPMELAIRKSYYVQVGAYWERYPLSGMPRWSCGEEGMIDGEVIAWAPLPEPYRAKQ